MPRAVENVQSQSFARDCSRILSADQDRTPSVQTDQALRAFGNAEPNARLVHATASRDLARAPGRAGLDAAPGAPAARGGLKENPPLVSWTVPPDRRAA